MRFIKFCFSLLLYFSGIQTPWIAAYGQGLKLTSLNSSNSLTQNSVQCILKDKFGLIWIGTQYGLNSYNGYEFREYKHIANDGNSLPANNILTICEDKEGNIWVGTRLGGLSKYDRAKDSFINYKSNPADKASLSSNSISYVYIDRRQNLWVGTDAGLDLFDSKTKSFTHFAHDSKDRGSLSNNNVLSIFEDSNQQFWVGTSGGLNQLDRESGKVVRFLHNSTDKKSLSDNRIYAITEDEKHNVWIATQKGLCLFDRRDRSFIRYENEMDRHTINGDNPIYCLAVGNKGKLWVGTNTTLQLFDTERKEFIAINGKSARNNKMPNDGIYAVMSDQQNILWIGTSSEGILKYDPNLTVFPSFKKAIEGHPAAKNIVRGISADRNNNLYLATDDGLDFYNVKDASYFHYGHNPAVASSLSSNYTSAVLMNKANNAVWVGTYNSGLDCLDPRTGKFKHYREGSLKTDINSNAIYALMEDSKGNIWIGTLHGVSVFNPNTGTFEKFVRDEKNEHSISDDEIEALYEDKKGNIWLGGYSHGISIFNPVTKSFNRINTRNSDLNSDVISAFYEDSRGDMWVGTMEGGLNRLDRNSGKFTSYTEDNGLVNNTINYITGDSHGLLWLTTLKGITSFNPATGVFKNYGTHNGLESREFNLNSAAKLPDGRIAVGNINGFNIVDPKNVDVNNNKPAVVITGFELFNKPLHPGGDNSPLTENILTTKEIKLDYSHSVFTIEYAALGYTISEENKYAYKLEGFDKEWRFVDNKRNVTYTNLDPGTYTFLVKAANNDGVWNETATSLRIIIRPPFWMTFWFRATFIIVLAAAAYTIYNLRVAFHKKQKAELKKQVRERTEEISQQAQYLKQLNDELQMQAEELQVQSEELQSQSWELLKQKEEEQKARLEAEKAKLEADKANTAKSTFLATMSHEIRTPMNGVLGMASLMAETKLSEEQHEYTEAILNSGEVLLSVINDILDFSKIESGYLELDPHDFELRKCIDEVLNLLRPKTLEAGISLNCRVEDTIPNLVLGDSLRLRQVLINLIGNAIKFTHSGGIFIEVNGSMKNNGLLQLDFEVRDTGIGIPESQVENLFKPFNQIDSSITRKYGGTGLGLVISERLVKLMGGNIKVKSKQGVGSSFMFNIICEKALAQVSTGLIEDGIYAGKKVLVIDNNETNVRILKVQLEKWRMAVTAVVTGKEALQVLAEQTDVDLVLIDMHIPDMDGIALSRQIKLINASIPLILLSSSGSENKKTYTDLFSSVLTKPIRKQQLYDEINFVLARAGRLKIAKKKTVLSEQFASDHPFEMLVAEDNLINQKLIIRVLNKLGYQPDLAVDGREVLEMMTRKSYDIILMDVQMPHIDGLEAARMIRDRYGERPLILAMTANALDEDKDNCYKAGMDDYLSKPINLELLTNTLKRLSATVEITG